MAEGWDGQISKSRSQRFHHLRLLAFFFLLSFREKGQESLRWCKPVSDLCAFRVSARAVRNKKSPSSVSVSLPFSSYQSKGKLVTKRLERDTDIRFLDSFLSRSYKLGIWNPTFSLLFREYVNGFQIPSLPDLGTEGNVITARRILSYLWMTCRAVIRFLLSCFFGLLSTTPSKTTNRRENEDSWGFGRWQSGRKEKKARSVRPAWHQRREFGVGRAGSYRLFGWVRAFFLALDSCQILSCQRESRK